MSDEIEHLKDKIGDLQDRIREVEITLHGKRARTGLLAEYQRHDELLTRIYAVIWQDATGKKGLLHDIDVLIGNRHERAESRKLKWGFWTSITVALITSTSLLLTNLEKLKSLMPKYHPSPLERKIERAKHKKGKPIIRYRIKVTPPNSIPTKTDPGIPPEGVE